MTDEDYTRLMQQLAAPATTQALEASAPRQPWWRRYFSGGHGWPEMPRDPRPAWRTRVQVTVDWRDRLRLLVSGRCEVLVTTYTEVEVRQAQSISSFAVLPPATKGDER